jgi:hypothetical protein
MTGTVTRALMTRADAAWWDGKTATYERTDSTGGTLTGLRWGNAVDVLQVYGAGTNRTAGALLAAVRAIGSSDAVLALAPGTWSIDSDVTVPSSLALAVPAGAVLSIDSGKTLTLNGPLIAGPWQVFTGDGTVTGFGGSHELYPEWWGAARDGATDDTAALQACLTAAKSVSRADGKIVRLLPGTYLTSDLVAGEESVGDWADHPTAIVGAGWMTVLKAKTGTSTVLSVRNATAMRLQGFLIQGDQKADYGLDTTVNWASGTSHQCHFEDIWIDGCLLTSWVATENNDDTILHVVTGGDVVGGTYPATAIDISATGGMVSFVNCLFTAGTIKLGAQNASFQNCVTRGVHVGYSSFNNLRFDGCYVYADSHSGNAGYQTCLWLEESAYNVLFSGCFIDNAYGSNGAIIDGAADGLTAGGASFIQCHVYRSAGSGDVALLGGSIGVSGTDNLATINLIGGVYEYVDVSAVAETQVNLMNVAEEGGALFNSTWTVGGKTGSGAYQTRVYDQGIATFYEGAAAGTVTLTGGTAYRVDGVHFWIPGAGGATFDANSVLVLGGHYLWVDTSGDLCIKASAPTGIDDAGRTVVGAQS